MNTVLNYDQRYNSSGYREILRDLEEYPSEVTSASTRRDLVFGVLAVMDKEDTAAWFFESITNKFDDEAAEMIGLLKSTYNDPDVERGSFEDLVVSDLFKYMSNMMDDDWEKEQAQMASENNGG